MTRWIVFFQHGITQSCPIAPPHLPFHPYPAHPATPGWHQTLSDRLLGAQGVARSAGRGWEPAARRSSQPRSQLFSLLSAFSRLFQRLGKGWGSPFCGLWMSRNDGGGAIRLLYGPGQTLIYGQFSRYAPLAFIIWAYFHLKETICWAWNWKSVSKWAEAAWGQKWEYSSGFHCHRLAGGQILTDFKIYFKIWDKENFQRCQVFRNSILAVSWLSTIDSWWKSHGNQNSTSKKVVLA